MSSSSNKGVEKPGNESAKQKTTSETYGVDEVNVGVGDLSVKSDQNDGFLRSGAGKKQWIPQNPTSKSWCQPDVVQKLGLEDDELDLPDDDSDKYEFLSGDDLYDHSDMKEMSFEERKKSRWFKKFFQCLDKLTITTINDPERQWHCPACKGDPGGIMWFKGLQSLVLHTKTKGGSKLHRELAQLLEEELRLRGTTVVPASEVYGQWDGVESEDKKILWPPMVIIMNTALAKDDNEKRIGMGNQELRDFFSSCTLINSVRHSYGPQGHRGISVLIFEATAMGYIQAQVLC
uniref:XS domain-containing protein n=1 Tax=Solanum lycopersicum TaxID=4081 RepID=A0A3Q7GD68_SOLLC